MFCYSEFIPGSAIRDYSRGLDGSFGILATKLNSVACKANNCPNHGTISLYLISFFFILGRRQKLLEQGEKWPAGCV